MVMMMMVVVRLVGMAGWLLALELQRVQRMERVSMQTGVY